MSTLTPTIPATIRRLSVAVVLVSLLGAPAAWAATTATGTATVTLSAGALSVGSVSNNTITGTVGGTSNGTLPSASWADTTGSGAGWNGTVAVSSLTYTGTWTALGAAPALLTTSSGAFTDTVDGVTYTVTTGAIALGVGSFTYTSTDTNDPSGSGTAVASANNAVGTKGVTINFGTQTIASGSQYRIKVGTQAASALSLNTAAPGAAITPAAGTTSPSPTFVNNTVTVSGGGPAPTAYGPAVKFVSAAVTNGMGTYTVVPGVQFVSDANAWAASYTAGVQYSIVTGP